MPTSTEFVSTFAGSDSPGQPGGRRARASARARLRRARDVVRHGVGRLQQRHGRLGSRRGQAEGRGQRRGGGIAHRGVQAVARRRPRPGRARPPRADAPRRRPRPRARRRARRRSGTAGRRSRARPSRGRARRQPSTRPIEAVAASRGTWLQRSTQPSQPVPKAASRTCPRCVLRMQQIAAAAMRRSTRGGERRDEAAARRRPSGRAVRRRRRLAPPAGRAPPSVSATITPSDVKPTSSGASWPCWCQPIRRSPCPSVS